MPIRTKPILGIAAVVGIGVAMVRWISVGGDLFALLMTAVFGALTLGLMLGFIVVSARYFFVSRDAIDDGSAKLLRTIPSKSIRVAVPFEQAFAAAKSVLERSNILIKLVVPERGYLEGELHHRSLNRFIDPIYRDTISITVFRVDDGECEILITSAETRDPVDKILDTVRGFSFGGVSTLDYARNNDRVAQIARVLEQLGDISPEVVS